MDLNMDLDMDLGMDLGMATYFYRDYRIELRTAREAESGRRESLPTAD